MSDVRLSLDEVRALALRGLAASGISNENAAESFQARIVGFRIMAKERTGVHAA